MVYVVVMGVHGEKYKSYLRAVVSGDEEQVGQLQGDQVEEGPEGVWKARVLQGGLEGAALVGALGPWKGIASSSQRLSAAPESVPVADRVSSW